MNDILRLATDQACPGNYAEQDDRRPMLYGELLQRVRELAQDIEQRVEEVMANEPLIPSR
jgi:hypothetical protein